MFKDELKTMIIQLLVLVSLLMIELFFAISFDLGITFSRISIISQYVQSPLMLGGEK